ncbi:MAG: VOC family protein [Pirellulales bacterium]|nr:VOC family protein [Pirellulales bacterium]
MSSHGQFNWMELQTRDPQTATAFYEATVGWTFAEETMPSGGTYRIAFSSGKPVCGILTLDNDAGTNLQDRWIAYLHVDDIDVAVQRALDAGATLQKAPWDVPGVGRVAMLREPGGAEVGWVTPVAGE